MILEDLRGTLGFERQLLALPPPATEMRPQVLEIVRKLRADRVMNHLFGRDPAVSLKQVHASWLSRESDAGLRVG